MNAITARRSEDILELVASDPSPLVERQKAAIRAAVIEAGAHGRFSVADVRPLIEIPVRDKLMGATINAMRNERIIKHAGYAESGNAAQRNTHRPVRAWRLVVAK